MTQAVSGSTFQGSVLSISRLPLVHPLQSRSSQLTGRAPARELCIAAMDKVMPVVGGLAGLYVAYQVIPVTWQLCGWLV